MADELNDGTNQATSVADQLLRAGREMLLATPPRAVLPGVRAVCATAGISTSSFYWCFADVEDYWRDLLASIADHDIVQAFSIDTEAALDAATELIHEDRSQALPLVRGLAAGNLDFHLGDGRQAVHLQLLLLGAAATGGPVADSVRAEYRKLYDAIGAAHDGAYERLLDAWGRTPRDPFTVRSISVLLTALADGLLLRALLEDGTDVITLFEDAVVSLLAVVTTSDGDDRDLAAVVAEALP